MAVIAACASEQFPPGGPERHAPPRLIELIPETNAVNVTTNRAVFRFDEVVSKLPTGVESLDKLFLVSPNERKAPVSAAWHRTHISLSPRHGFRPNTVYTITMLPGMTDLRGNSIKRDTTLTFSTGSTIPPTAIRGVIFDWVKGTIAPKALIEAWAPSDTNTIWVAVADSNGRFTMPHLPGGPYTLRGYIDQNNNRRLDLRELWDSVGVKLTDSANVELLTFIHDTIGPRIAETRLVDSVTLRLTFDKGVDVNQSITPALFTLKAKDSTAIPITTAVSGRTYDSVLTARNRVRDDSVLRADSAKRAAAGGVGARDTAAQRARNIQRQSRRDSTREARLLKPSKPSPVTDAVLSLGLPLTPGSFYRASSIGLRNLLGHPRTAFLVFTVPKRDTTKADSTRGRRGLRGRLPAQRDSVPRRDSIPQRDSVP
ncbi:MAG TPA: Ig-like domain-containing domain [Gemmatimonadaceae bacterium]|nr:Ig-like domain-containing domain [Gemmatimonadaceae bacterium]